MKLAIAMSPLLVFCASTVAQPIKAHPWIADAPGAFVRLIDRGNVKIAVDDERVRMAGKSALTLFHFVVDYDFKFRHQVLGYDEETMTWQAKIVAWMDHPSVRLEHTVCVQSTFTPASPWESKLLRHEFDHVAISTDPRLSKIINRTLQQRREWVARFQQTLAPSESDIRKEIRDRVVAEVKTLEQLIQAQYDLLDTETLQGLSEIAKRDAFFQGLYTVEGIERCKYMLAKSMREFVKDKLNGNAGQKEVQAHYLFLSP